MLKKRALLTLVCAAACCAPLLALTGPAPAALLPGRAPLLGLWLRGLDLGLALLAVLAWRLNQNRLAVICLGLGLAQAWLQAAAPSAPAWTLADGWLLAVPGGLALGLLAPRGALWSGRTLGCAALLALPAGLARALSTSSPREWAHFLAWGLGGRTGLPSPAAHAGLAVFAWAAYRGRARIEAALLALGGSLAGLTALGWGLALAHADAAVRSQAWLAGGLAQAGCLGLGLFLLYWQRVYVDELTAVPNRRALDERLEHLTGAYSLAMVDIDHFKKFNDTYGHAQGDDVLRRVAQHLRERTGGRAYRYGGEEFCVLAPDLDAKGLARLMDSTRASLAKRRFTIRAEAARADPKAAGRKVQITVSVGVAQGDARTPAARALKLADEGLYEAKEAGRNMVISKR